MFKKSLLPSLTMIALIALVSCGSSSQINKDKVTDIHNSQNALDWDGVYRGILPCADCEGIEATLSLGKDNHYRLQTKYLGTKEGEKDTFSDSGEFSWSKNGQVVRLENGNQYFVGENFLNQLDQEGKEITGKLADHYTLAKLDHQLTETYWKLIELEGEKVVVDSTFNKEPHITLRDRDNRVSGNGGCNQLMGTYQLGKDYQISFSKMASTMMACPDLKMEQQFTQVFEKADHYKLFGEEMELLAGDTVLAKFVAVYFH